MINGRNGQANDHSGSSPGPKAVRHRRQKSTGYQSRQAREEGQPSTDSTKDLTETMYQSVSTFQNYRSLPVI